MKANEMQNLWVGCNRTEDFKVLICAFDEIEAHEVAESYRIDTHMEGNFEITEFTNMEEKFDCDYVITYSDSPM